MNKTIDKQINLAKDTLKNEADALLVMANRLNQSFVQSVEAIYQSRGRVVVTGIGKSAIIAQKMVATFNSTGTPSVFMHAADAIHGDLGTIQQNDVIICISKSGTTPEIKALIPLLKRGGNKLIAMVGNMNSYLALQADFVLDTTVEKEACPNNLAPTTSTTAQLAMGDALAVCLLDYRGFSGEDFAKFHPGGALGKRLYLKVGDLSSQHAMPQVKPTDTIREVIMEISSKRLGATAVVENNQLLGIITDGDLRRMLEQQSSWDTLVARDIMNAKPKTIEQDELAIQAVTELQQHQISQLVVVHQGVYQGFIHLHDLLKEGLL